MPERPTTGGLHRILCGAALLVVLCLLPVGTATAHDIGIDYEIELTSVTPEIPGLEIVAPPQAGELMVTNRSGKEIAFAGYEGEPYVRFDADGKVWVNQHAPAHWLNEDTYAAVELPPEADAEAEPDWKLVSRRGLYTWHDHRIHWMSPEPPPRMKDVTERTKIFDWDVPFTVDGQAGSVKGALWWVGRSETPVLATVLVLSGAGLLLAFGVVLWYRRTWGEAEDPEDPDDSDEAGLEAGAEAADETATAAAPDPGDQPPSAEQPEQKKTKKERPKKKEAW